MPNTFLDLENLKRIKDILTTAQHELDRARKCDTLVNTRLYINNANSYLERLTSSIDRVNFVVLNLPKAEKRSRV